MAASSKSVAMGLETAVTARAFLNRHLRWAGANVLDALLRLEQEVIAP